MRIYYKYWIFVAAPILIVAWLGVLGRDFVTLAISHNPTLNYAILGVMAGAVLLSLVTHLRFWNEAHAIERFAAAPVDAAPPTEDRRATAARSGVSAILSSIGHARRQPGGVADKAALIKELDTLRSSYAARFSLPHFLGGFMVALGLFGTFIGLLETLNATSALLGRFSIGGSPNGAGDAVGQAVGRLVVGMTGPLGGMGTAFSASLFGLLGSLLLGAISSATEGMSGRILERLRGIVDTFAAERPISAANEPSDPQPILSPEFLAGFLKDILAQQRSLADLTAASLRADLEARQFLADLSERFATGGQHFAKVGELVREMQHASLEQALRIELLTDLQLQNDKLIKASQKTVSVALETVGELEKITKDAVSSSATIAKNTSVIATSIDRMPDLVLSGSNRIAELQAKHADYLEGVERHHVQTLERLASDLDSSNRDAAQRFVEHSARLERTNDQLARLLEEVALARTEPHASVPAIELLIRRLDTSRAELNHDITIELREIGRQLAKLQAVSTH